ncbi:MAG: flippase [Candidatus Omnitrophica bacterium]|nr:flippase [Candidatus Omnitrophota bacterium]
MADDLMIESPHITLADKIFRNTFFNIIGRLWGMIVLFLLTPYVVGKIGIERYGVWAIIGAFTGYFGLLDFGLKNSFKKYIAEFNAKDDRETVNKIINTGFVFYALLSLILIASSYVFIKPIIGFFNIPSHLYEETAFVFFLGIVLFGVINTLNPFESVQIGLQRFDINNILSIICMTLSAFGTIFFLEAGYGLTGLMLNNVIIAAIRGAISFIIAFRIYPYFRFNPIKFDAGIFKKLFDFGYKMQITSVANIFAHQTDKVLITYFLSVSLVSFYHLGCSIIHYLMVIPNLLSSALMPAFSDVEARGQREKLISIHNRCTKYISFVVVPMFVFAIVISDHFMKMWMGPGYETSGYVIRILAVGWLFNALAVVSVSTCMAINKPHFMSISAAIMVCVNVFLSIILIKLFGFYGSPWGTTFAVGIGTMIFIVLLHRELKIAVFDFFRVTLPYGAICIFAVLAYLLIEIVIGRVRVPQNRIVELCVVLIHGICFSAVYLAGVFYAKIFDKVDIQFVEHRIPYLYRLLNKIDTAFSQMRS